MGALKDPQAVEPLIHALCDTAGSVRLAAAQSLAGLGEQQWVKFKQAGQDRILKDISCLGTSGDDRVIGPLIEALERGDADMRRFAVQALGGFKKNIRAQNALISALRDQDRTVAYDASSALMGEDDPQVKEAREYYYRRLEADAIRDSVERLSKRYPDKEIY